jgi:hypothetical protein
MDSSDDSGSSADEEVEARPGGSYSGGTVEDENLAAEAKEEVAAPTAKGSTRVSRIVWEVIRTSDAVIRQPCAVQVDALLEKMAELRVAWEPVPVALQTAHRHLSESCRFRRLLVQMEATPDATPPSNAPSTAQTKASAADEQHKLWYCPRGSLHKRII